MFGLAGRKKTRACSTGRIPSSARYAWKVPAGIADLVDHMSRATRASAAWALESCKSAVVTVDTAGSRSEKSWIALPISDLPVRIHPDQTVDRVYPRGTRSALALLACAPPGGRSSRSLGGAFLSGRRASGHCSSARAVTFHQFRGRSKVGLDSHRASAFCCLDRGLDRVSAPRSQLTGRRDRSCASLAASRPLPSGMTPEMAHRLASPPERIRSSAGCRVALASLRGVSACCQNGCGIVRSSSHQGGKLLGFFFANHSVIFRVGSVFQLVWWPAQRNAETCLAGNRITLFRAAVSEMILLPAPTQTVRSAPDTKGSKGHRPDIVRAAGAVNLTSNLAKRAATVHVRQSAAGKNVRIAVRPDRAADGRCSDAFLMRSAPEPLGTDWSLSPRPAQHGLSSMISSPARKFPTKRNGAHDQAHFI